MQRHGIMVVEDPIIEYSRTLITLMENFPRWDDCRIHKIYCWIGERRKRPNNVQSRFLSRKTESFPENSSFVPVWMIHLLRRYVVRNYGSSRHGLHQNGEFTPNSSILWNRFYTRINGLLFTLSARSKTVSLSSSSIISKNLVPIYSHKILCYYPKNKITVSRLIVRKRYPSQCVGVCSRHDSTRCLWQHAQWLWCKLAPLLVKYNTNMGICRQVRTAPVDGCWPNHDR